MIIMALAPSTMSVKELNDNTDIEYGHGSDSAGTAQMSGNLSWQDDAWNATWTCNGGLALVTPSDWNDFVNSGESDPHNYTSWAINLTGAGSYATGDAPAGTWVVTAGLTCTDDVGVWRSAGGQFGDSHESPDLVNLSIDSILADISFMLIEHGEDMGGDEPTFICGNGTEIPFEYVNDGELDCADGADEQQYDANGTEINWFDCHDGSEVWIHQVNDGTVDCPDAEDEGDVSAAEDDMDCAESDLQMSLHYDAAGDIYFEMTMDCAFSQEDSDDMRAMYDLYFGDGDGILNESEAAILIEMMTDSEEDDEDDNTSGEDGNDENWTIDGISVEMPEDGGTWENLANPSVPISISTIMTTDSIADDGTGTHTVMFVSNPDDVDDGDDPEECTSGSIVSNSDFAPISVVFTPATQWTIGDMGDHFDFDENPSTTGECNADGPGSATMVFDSVEGEPVDTEPSCAYTWTIATDTSWETETGIILGPDGDETITFEPGSYMIAVQCTDAENDVINAAWSNADGTLSASETGNGTVFGWVQFTIPDGVTGTMEVDYEWDSTTFGSNGTIYYNFASNGTADPGDEIVGTGGGLPGFTSLMTITALLGAVLFLGRRD